ncbi:MAG TPA: hypothetical protein VJR05_10185 [Acidimicrobiia bacterium]|nr:hypothetical protein [Acidimicrobiia bacterium]
MSRYMVNKLMWEVERSQDSLTAFRHDPGGFLDRWEATEPEPPYPEGGKLTATERAALEAVDYRTLYAMGAHPFILWQFVRALSTEDPAPLVTRYREATADLGYPDFAT